MVPMSTLQPSPNQMNVPMVQPVPGGSYAGQSYPGGSYPGQMMSPQQGLLNVAIPQPVPGVVYPGSDQALLPQQGASGQSTPQQGSPFLQRASSQDEYVLDVLQAEYGQGSMSSDRSENEVANLNQTQPPPYQPSET